MLRRFRDHYTISTRNILYIPWPISYLTTPNPHSYLVLKPVPITCSEEVFDGVSTSYAYFNSLVTFDFR